MPHHLLRSSVILPLFAFNVFLLLSQAKSSDACPIECTCKWKNGKQTAECVGANLVGIPSGLSKETQVLDLTGNLLQLLASKAFESVGLVNLQRVYASRCGILNITDDALYHLSNLIELDLSSNFITRIPALALRDTTLLRRLLLSNNPIQKIEKETFSLLVHLTVLELSNCQIERIDPEAFVGLKSLEYLKLDNNRLTTLPPEALKPFSTLYELDLHQNPWYCDCRIRSVRMWMKRYNVPISWSPQCTEPSRLRGLSWDTVGIDDFACKPEVTAVEPTVTYTEGDNATLGCRIYAIPEANINWIWRGRVINNLTLMSFGRQMYLIREVGTTHKVSSLTIFNVMLKDGGRYLCVATNPTGRVSANITLSVYPKEDDKSALRGEEIAGIVIGVLFVIFAIFFLFSFIMLRHQRLFGDRSKGEGFTIYKHFFSFNHHNGESNVKNSAAIDGPRDGAINNDTQHIPDGKCNATPISPGSGSETSAYGIAKTNNVVPVEQYSLHEGDQLCNQIGSPNSENRFSRTFNRHSIRETEKGIEMCVLRPVDKGGSDKDDKSWKSSLDGDGDSFVTIERTEYRRNPRKDMCDDEDDDVEDRKGMLLEVRNSAEDDPYFLGTDIPNYKCAIWPLSEGSFKDESYHSYSSPSQSSWKRSSVAIPQQIHHVFSPDARDSPDEGLGDEREYETDILD